MSRIPESAQNIESVFPLSSMQEGMLFHTLLQPRSGVYLMQNRYRLEGEIHEEHFVEAWRSVVARHPTLRTSFAWKTQKRPLQVVQRRVELPFDRIDLRGLSPGEQEARVSGELQEELQRGFDFSKAPLQHFRLVRLGERSYELIHSFHHILLDEWCTSLLMTEFFALYRALQSGERVVLPEVRPYKDYVDWLGRQDRDREESFWRRSLAGFSGPNSFGFDEGPTNEAGMEDISSRLDLETTRLLSELAQSHRFTLNTLVQGAWALLLSRYAGDEDVLFGVTVAGRPPTLPGVESIVGLFINTLPLRVRVPGEQRWIPWLQEIFRKNLELRDYEHSPLVDVQSWSELGRGQELFQSLFVFENAPIDPSLRETGGIRVEAVQDRVHTNYPVTVMGWPDDELGLKISYDRSKIRPRLARELLENLRATLESMARDPEARLADLSILAEPARQRALTLWSYTGPAPEAGASYAERFVETALRSPTALAVRSGDRALTYGELYERAAQVAFALQERGVGPEDRVLVALDRDVEFLVAILGVFLVGAAYVPVELSYPDERIVAVALSSAPRVILTDRPARGRLEVLLERTEISAWVLSVEDALAAPSRGVARPTPRQPQHLAYVIYTSGSTGVPKGAMVEERGFLNNMVTKIPRLGLEPGSVIAQTASVCFDISVWQFLAAALVGACVEIVPDDVARDPERLARYVDERKISILEVVPGVLQGILRAVLDERASLGSLRWVLPTGEALPIGLARQWLERLPEVPLLNAYGPAECSDDVALHPMSSPPDVGELQTAIGRPVEGLRIYVLDRFLHPSPVGVRGELYVGGVGVGRGYLGEPRRTALAFLPDPFSTEPGARLYRTGDLARYRVDGTLEFAGRTDHQVKVRGFRIELGEIEARLSEHPAAGEVVVLAREDRPGTRRLVAYLTASGADGAPTDEALRAWLGERLPEYMVPAAFVRLEALPRTPNGKLDRRALPAPGGAADDEYVAPRDETEERLATLWAELLGVPRVGVKDSFFELGGHSLLLTQVLARIRRVFDVELPLDVVFAAQTVEAQARAVRRAQGGAESQAAPLERKETQDARELSLAQSRLWFLAQLDPDSAAYNIPVALRLEGPLDRSRLERALARVVERHEGLRVGFEEGSGRLLARVVEASSLQLEQVEARDEEDARRLLVAAARRPFRLSNGEPLLRATLIHWGEHAYALGLVVHHIVADGWSLEVLLSEVTQGYAAPDAPLPELPLQYADYAEWQRRELAGERGRAHVEYFRGRLSGDALEPLELPADFMRPAVRSEQGARLPFAVSKDVTERVRALAKRTGTSPFMVLLTAFSALLGRRSGRERFTVGTPVAGRTRLEFEPLIGLFVNTLVLALDVGGESTFEEALERVRPLVLEAQAHQDVPFERLVQALSPTRDLSRTPLFQVLFSLQESRRLPEELGELRLSPLEIDSGSAQFDLSLHMILEGDELSGSFEYAIDLFEEASIVRWRDDFLFALETFVQAPSLRLGELALTEWDAAAPRDLREPRRAEGAGSSGEERPLPLDPSASSFAGLPPSSEERLARLGEIWASVLGRAEVRPEDNFFELGGDSILSLQVVSRARQLGVFVTARQMFQYQTLGELAAAGARELERFEQGRASGEVRLLPIQRRFFAREEPNPHHFNQSLFLRAPGRLDRAAVRRAVEALVERHDALRLRFHRQEDGWRQEYAPEAQLEVHWTDLSRWDATRGIEVMQEHASRWQASLDLSAGPVLRLVGFELGGTEGTRLLWIAHHLVVDGVSWRVLLDDFVSSYERIERGEAPLLPPKTLSLQAWGERLAEGAKRYEIERECSVWLELPWRESRPLVVERPDGARTEEELGLGTWALEPGTTRLLLEEAPERHAATVEEIVLAAFAQALARWQGSASVTLDLEGHGREGLGEDEIDLSRTVGWLTSVYPVVLTVPEPASPATVVRAARERLRRLPRRGLSFGIVREWGESETAAALRRLPEPEIAFNYLGQWDAALGEEARFSLAEESTGVEHDPRSPLRYELEVDAAVHGGRFEASIRYSRARFSSATIQRLSRLFEESLLEIVTWTSASSAEEPHSGEFSDVPLADGELDFILGQLS